MLKGMLVLGIAATVALTGCDSDKAKKVAKNDNDFEKIVAACWKKYEHDDSDLTSDPKCSNFAVVDRFMRVGKNRECGYPDLYNGEYNYKDLSNLSKKDSEYTRTVLSCAQKYLSLDDFKGGVDGFRLPQALKLVNSKIAEDKACNMPAVKERVAYMLQFSGFGAEADKGHCWK